MTEKALLQGEEIKTLIPQREPIMMIDTFYGADANDGESGLCVKESNIFCEDGLLREPGVVEHIAQTAAAFNGTRLTEGSKPKLGYIGEIKKCEIVRLPKVGEKLRTHVHLEAQVMNVNLMTAETTINGEKIASCQIKLFEEE